MIRRIRVWVALFILPRDWQASGPLIALTPDELRILRRVVLNELEAEE